MGQRKKAAEIDEEKSEPMTTERLLVHAITRGLCVADLHEMSIGMIVEYINQYDQLHSNKENEEEHIRKASQIEFNSF